MRASIVILAWRNVEHLGACLASLRLHIPAWIPHEIILVLNGASAEVRAFVADHQAGLVIVDHADNLGFAGGCNLGAAAARGEYVVFLNDDTVVEPSWLESLLETADAHPRAAAVGSQVLFLDGSLQEAGSVVFADGSTLGVGRSLPQDPADFDFVRQVDYCSACSLLVRRTAWDAAGGFDEDYHPAYYEDADFCLEVRSLGFSVLYDPRSRVRHVESASSTGEMKTFLLLRSRERFVSQWQDELGWYEPAQPASPAAIQRAIWRARGMPRRVLVIDDRVPGASFGSGIGRLRQMIATLSATDAVTICPTDPRSPVDADWLRARGVGLVRGPLDAYLARPEVLFDVVLISRPHNFAAYAGLVREHQPQAAVVYDAEALYCRRLERQAALQTDALARADRLEEASRLAAIETEIARSADAITTVSRTEARWYRSRRGAPGVFAVPPVAPSMSAAWPGFAARRDLLFVAGWLDGAHSPNLDGLTWLLQHVWPWLATQVPSIALKITGHPSLELEQLVDTTSGIELLGAVPDLAPLYASTLGVVAPVRYGAGVKMKIVEAIEHGVPVVTTSVGVEGISVAGDAVAVADRPDRFAAKLAELVQSEPAWNRRHTAAVALADRWRAVAGGRRWPGVLAYAHYGITGESATSRARRASASPVGSLRRE